MSKLFAIEPEVGGDWGEATIISNRAQLQSGEATIPEISYLEYLFDVWLGDCIVQGDACYIVTLAVAEAMTEAALTGADFTTVTITLSDNWLELKPHIRLPPFRRLLPRGVVHIKDGDQLIYWSGHDVCWGQRIDHVYANDADLVDIVSLSVLPYSLVVTEQCLALLQQHQLDHCQIEELRQGEYKQISGR